jgi:TP901 family phage tail tape measure protein
MSFEAYKISVRVALANEVSAGILLIAKQFGMAGAAAKEFQGRLNSIKATAGAGVALVGGAGAIAAPFIMAIDKAAQLQKEMIGIQVATRGTTTEMDSMRRSIEAVAGQTVFSAIDVAKMAKIVASGTGLGAKQVEGLVPEYAKFADVQQIMKGTPYEKSVTDAIRLAHTAGKYDPQSLGEYLNLLTKASFIVPGDLGEVGHALKYSQGVARATLGVDDENMVVLTALLNRMGFAGSRGGTNLVAAMTRTIPGIFGSGLLTGKSNDALQAMHMVDAQGHSKFMKNGKFDAFAWIGGLSEYVAQEMARNPEGIARQHILTNMQHAFGTQGSRVASLLADPQSLSQLQMIGEAFSQYGGVDQIQKKFADESVWQQYTNAVTNFDSAMAEMGITVLPQVTVLLKGLNSQLQNLTEWIAANPGKVKVLTDAFIGLAGAMAFGGTVLLLKAGFQGIATVFSAGAGLIGAVNTLSGPSGILMLVARFGTLGLAIGALGAAAALVYSAIPKSEDHTGMKQVRAGSGKNAPWVWVHDDDYTPPKNSALMRQSTVHGSTVRPAPRQTVQVQTKIHLDGRQIANVVSDHVAGTLGMGMTGGGVDPNVTLPMPGVK